MTHVPIGPTGRPVRPTRGRRLRASLAAAAVVALAAACASNSAQSSTTSARELGTPVPGGTLVFAMQQEPYCINSHQGPQFAAQFITRTLADSLIAQSPDGKSFEPWLATSWEATEDAKHYTFTLREDVTFHDGEKLNAAAVKANFDMFADPAAKASGAALFLGNFYESSEVLGEYQIRINFSKGHASFLQAASTPYLSIQSPKTLATDGACKGAVGSGPFTFESYTKQGSVKVKRNPDYNWGPPYAYHQGAAYLDGIEFRFVPEESTRTGSLTSGQVDAIDGASARQVDLLERQGFSLIRSDQPGQPWMGHLNTRDAPFNDVEVRRAFREAIDFDGILQALWGGKYLRSWGPITQFTPGYDPSVENSWKYDVDSANRRLDAAGWTGRDSEGFRTKDGQRLTVVWLSEPNELREQRPDFVQLVKEQVKKVGIDLDYVQVSANDATARRAAGEFSVYAHSYVRAEPAQLDRIFHSRSNNISFTNNPQIDQWLEAAQATTDPAARAAEYAKVQQYVTDQAIVLPIYVQSQFVFFSAKVHGITTDATGWVQFYDAWKSA
jgi:peptide/nickel transport system substrate-binding protein